MGEDVDFWGLLVTRGIDVNLIAPYRGFPTVFLGSFLVFFALILGSGSTSS